MLLFCTQLLFATLELDWLATQPFVNSPGAVDKLGEITGLARSPTDTAGYYAVSEDGVLFNIKIDADRWTNPAHKTGVFLRSSAHLTREDGSAFGARKQFRGADVIVGTLLVSSTELTTGKNTVLDFNLKSGTGTYSKGVDLSPGMKKANFEISSIATYEGGVVIANSGKATGTEISPARICQHTRKDDGTLQPSFEVRYDLDMIDGNTLTDLVVLNSGKLLAMEHAPLKTEGHYSTRVYELGSLTAVDDVLHCNNLKEVCPKKKPVSKTLLADLSEDNFLGNYQSMTVAEKGTSNYLVVSSFSDTNDAQTKFLLFALNQVNETTTNSTKTGGGSTVLTFSLDGYPDAEDFLTQQFEYQQGIAAAVHIASSAVQVLDIDDLPDDKLKVEFFLKECWCTAEACMPTLSKDIYAELTKRGIHMAPGSLNLKTTAKAPEKEVGPTNAPTPAPNTTAPTPGPNLTNATTPTPAPTAATTATTAAPTATPAPTAPAKADATPAPTPAVTTGAPTPAPKTPAPTAATTTPVPTPAPSTPAPTTPAPKTPSPTPAPLVLAKAGEACGISLGCAPGLGLECSGALNGVCLHSSRQSGEACSAMHGCARGLVCTGVLSGVCVVTAAPTPAPQTTAPTPVPVTGRPTRSPTPAPPTPAPPTPAPDVKAPSGSGSGAHAANAHADASAQSASMAVVGVMGLFVTLLGAHRFQTYICRRCKRFRRDPPHVRAARRIAHEERQPLTGEVASNIILDTGSDNVIDDVAREGEQSIVQRSKASNVLSLSV